MGYNRLRTMHDNTEAIILAFKLRNERRGPGIEECGVLMKYAGFGGLKCILNPADDINDVVPRQWNYAV